MFNKQLLILIISVIINVILILYLIIYNNSNLVKAPGIYIKSPSPVAHHYDRGTPIDRRYIFDFLNEHKDYIKGAVLEMCPREYADKFIDNITSVDTLTIDAYFKEATYIQDLQDTEKFPSNIYDCYICTQTLQYPYDIKATLKSSYKMLKKGGAMLITAPMLSQITRDTESWRYTEYSMRRLLEDAGFEVKDIRSYGNTFSSTLFLQGIAVEDIKNEQLLDEKDAECPMLVAALAIKK